MSSEARWGSHSIDIVHTKRTNIKIMCLSRGRKHAGFMRKRFSWQGQRRTSWSWLLLSPVRPWRNSSQGALLSQSKRCGRQRSIRESWNHCPACMERKTALLGGVLLLWRAPMEQKTVGWKGVISLKLMPPLVQHQCNPRLLKNSLRQGFPGPQTTDSAEQCGWSDALRRALETRTDCTWLSRRPGEERV